MSAEIAICPLCDRPLGRKRERHHVVPKSKGGTDMVAIHPICHRKIHRVFTNAELAALCAQGEGSIELLKSYPEMERFIRWLRRKPPNFHAPTR
ncbi:MAG: HNH endonuclease signature motif containing protein [Litorimonas sp.]